MKKKQKKQVAIFQKNDILASRYILPLQKCSSSTKSALYCEDKSQNQSFIR